LALHWNPKTKKSGTE